MKRFFAQYDSGTKIELLDKLANVLHFVIMFLFFFFRHRLGLIRFFEYLFDFTEYWAELASWIFPAIILAVENAIINHAKKRITQENPTEPPKES